VRPGPALRRAIVAVLLPWSGLLAQSSDSTARGWEWFVLPALNFSSDEGFGYGVIAVCTTTVTGPGRTASRSGRSSS